MSSVKKKNYAVLYYKDRSFIIWQNENLDWCFTCGHLSEVNTSAKELQQALNVIYETINETAPPKPKEENKQWSSKPRCRNGKCGVKKHIVDRSGKDHK
jgi:hypothetical protein